MVEEALLELEATRTSKGLFEAEAARAAPVFRWWVQGEVRQARVSTGSAGKGADGARRES
jgi:hypothetical protein